MNWDVCLGCGGVGRVLGPGSGGVGWCYAYVRYESGFSVYLAGPGICILCLGAPSVAPYGYLLPNMYLFMADIANPDSFV